MIHLHAAEPIDGYLRRRRAPARLVLEQAIVRLEPAGFTPARGRARDDVAEMLSGPTFARVISELAACSTTSLSTLPRWGSSPTPMSDQPRGCGAAVVRAGKTRYSQSTTVGATARERVLGVISRTEDQPDANSYYYQKRYNNRDRGLPAESSSALPGETEKEVAIVR